MVRVLLLRVFLRRAIAAVAYVGVQRVPAATGRRSPSRSAGLPRLHDALARTSLNRCGPRPSGSTCRSRPAAFGEPEKAEFLVVVVNDGAGKTTEELFGSFTRGFTQGGAVVGRYDANGEVDGRQPTDASRRTAAGQQAGVCMWRADEPRGLRGWTWTARSRPREELTTRVYRAVD